MTDQQYTKIKKSLIDFQRFDEPTSFTDLFKHSKQYRHGVPFRRFNKIVRDMGVRAIVKRVGTTTKRVLEYLPQNDIYLSGNKLEQFERCEACDGSGVVEVSA